MVGGRERSTNPARRAGDVSAALFTSCGIRDADAAMYQAKAAGRARTRDEMRDAAVERLETETDLRNALERDELEVHFQAEVDLASGSYVGAEALVRCATPTGA